MTQLLELEQVEAVFAGKKLFWFHFGERMENDEVSSLIRIQ